MQGGDRAAYDRGTTTFSPDGRLYQVEYAREAVRRGAPTVGVRADDGVVFAAERRLRSPLVEAESVEKLHAVDEGVGIASAGHVADARRLVDVARRRAQGERLRYGEPAGVEALTKAVTDHVQEHTQTGGARPFGASLLVGGIEDGGPRLFETDPSGTPTEWRAVAIGDGGSDLLDHLADAYDDGLPLDAASDLALGALAESGGPFRPGDVDVAAVDPGGFRRWSAERRRDALERLGLLDGSAAS